MKINDKGKITSNLSRWILIIIGSFFTGLGILGIFLPLLPATPFLLLAAACYIRSSERFYNWLMNNKWLGSYIKNYLEGKGVSLKAKVLSISLLWITIGYSVIFVVNIFSIRVILILIAISVTMHLLFIRTSKEKR